MNDCNYCEENHLTHISPQPVLDIMFKMDQTDRLMLIKFIEQITNEHHYHVDLAINAIENNFCNHCGSVTEEKQKDNRNIYLCVNENCKSWK